jgi:hypothetical protein
MSRPRRAGPGLAAIALHAVAWLGLPLPAVACMLPAGWAVLAAGDDAAAPRLAWRAQPLRIPAGRPFAIEVRLCPHDAVLQAVDATMPEHRHGMNYAPRIEPQGAGRWRVDGLVWHMSGRWEWRFDVARGDGQVVVLRQAVDVAP